MRVSDKLPRHGDKPRRVLKARRLWPQTPAYPPRVKSRTGQGGKAPKGGPAKKPRAAQPDTGRGCRRGVAATAGSTAANIPGQATRRTPKSTTTSGSGSSRTRYFGKYKGRETVLGIAARTGRGVEDVQQWADEAASIVSRSWGSSELQLQASLAEWRSLFGLRKTQKMTNARPTAKSRSDRICKAR